MPETDPGAVSDVHEKSCQNKNVRRLGRCKWIVSLSLKSDAKAIDCLRPFSGYVEAPESTQGRTRKGATGKDGDSGTGRQAPGPSILGPEVNHFPLGLGLNLLNLLNLFIFWEPGE